jgi:phosphoketolase
MRTAALTPEVLTRMNAYWRAANYLSVGQIYLYDNALLRRPLKQTDVKPLWSDIGARPQDRISSTYILIAGPRP